MPGEKAGFQAAIYYKVGGVDAGGSWVLIGAAMDVTSPLQRGDIEATTRDSEGWERFLPGLRDGSIDFDMIHRPGNAAYEALADSFAADGDDAMIGIRMLDKETGDSDAEGIEGDYFVSKFQKDEQLKNAQKRSVTLKPHAGGQTPTFVDSL